MGNPSLNDMSRKRLRLCATQKPISFRQLRRNVMKQLYATALAEREVQIGEQDLVGSKYCQRN